MGIKRFRPVTPSLRFRTVPDFRRDYVDRAGEVAARAAAQNRAVATTRVASRPFSAAAVTNGSIASSISSATSTTFRLAWRRSNTIRIARPVSRLLHYADGEKRYILAPDELKVGDALVSGDEVEIRVGQCHAA